MELTFKSTYPQRSAPIVFSPSNSPLRRIGRVLPPKSSPSCGRLRSQPTPRKSNAANYWTSSRTRLRRRAANTPNLCSRRPKNTRKNNMRRNKKKKTLGWPWNDCGKSTRVKLRNWKTTTGKRWSSSRHNLTNNATHLTS